MTNSFGSHEESGWRREGIGGKGVEVVLMKRKRKEKGMEIEKGTSESQLDSRWTPALLGI